MKIGPVDNTGEPYRSHRGRKARANKGKQGPADPAPKEIKDSVELSGATAKRIEPKLIERATGAGNNMPRTNRPDEASDLDPNGIVDSPDNADKLEQARERIEAGYYDRPEVKAQIAKRIADDFLGS